MSALTLSALSVSQAQQQFTAALPAMEKVLRFQLRGILKRNRAEAIHDGVSACWHHWIGLVRRGRDPVATGPAGIAANAARYVRAGRQLGCGSRGRGVLDIFSKRAQRLLGFRIVGLDHQTESGTDSRSEAWRDWITEDRRVTPADEAAFRIDFDDWLAGLPARKRQMAELLVEGHETGVVARMLNVTPGAVSQSRKWLEAEWATFQADPISAV